MLISYKMPAYTGEEGAFAIGSSETHLQLRGEGSCPLLVTSPLAHRKVPSWQQMLIKFCSGIGIWREIYPKKQDTLPS